MTCLEKVETEIDFRLEVLNNLEPTPDEFQRGVIEGITMTKRIIEIIKKGDVEHV